MARKYNCWHPFLLKVEWRPSREWSLNLIEGYGLQPVHYFPQYQGDLAPEGSPFRTVPQPPIPQSQSSVRIIPAGENHARPHRYTRTHQPTFRRRQLSLQPPLSSAIPPRALLRRRNSHPHPATRNTPARSENPLHLPRNPPARQSRRHRPPEIRRVGHPPVRAPRR